MIYPKEFEDLLDDFKEFPGIGEKSAERFVYSIDSFDDNQIDKFITDIKSYKQNIRKCSICGHLTNSDVCNICSSNNRDRNVICVVEYPKNVFVFEKSGGFNGVYHVLGGLISPVDGVNPEDLNISSLLNSRITDDTEEVIIALNPTVEGEMTSLYIKKLLEVKNIKVSRLSYGIPIGADIDYLDPLTITRAMDDRKFLS